MKRLLIIFIFSLIGKISLAQYFTDTLFVSQIQSYLKPVINTNENNQILQTFLKFWQTDLSDSHQNFLDLFNEFEQKSLAKKDFLLYLDNSVRLLDLGKKGLLVQWTKFLREKLISKDFTHKTQQEIIYLNRVLTQNRISKQTDLGLIIDGEYDFFFKSDGSFTFRTLSAVNIKVFLQQDTLIIRSTSGTYNTSNHTWQANSGIIFWDRFKEIQDKAFAKFGKYSINTAKKSFEIPKVKFTLNYNAIKINNLDGKLVMRFSYSPGTQKRYPKVFVNRTLNLRKFIPQAIFYGKLSVEGKYVNLAGNVDFFLGKRKVITTSAHSYTVTTKYIKADKLVFNLLFEDSLVIYHPQVSMFLFFDSTSIYSKYPYLAQEALAMDKPRLLTFIRSKDGVGKQPFHDDYHKINIYAAEILWTFDTSLYFANTVNRIEDTCFFESYNYYDPQIFNIFYDERGNNYAKLLYQFLRKNNFPDTVDFDEFVNYLISLHINTFSKRVLYYLELMQSKGWLKIKYTEGLENMVIYDFSQKFYHVIKASLRKFFLKDPVNLKKYTNDYDRIKIYSLANSDTVSFASYVGNYLLVNMGICAVMNLNNYELRIKSPLPFDLSHIRQVRAIPKNLKIKKNFVLHFDGDLQAGLINLTGQNFVFDYNSFKVNLGFVKDMKMKFYHAVDSQYITSLITDKGDTLDVYRYKYKQDSLASVIHFFSGILYIDKENNKSGLFAKEDDEFPFLDVRTSSKIFYPNAPVDSSNFFFKNYPYRLNNLVFLTRDNIKLLGMFRSTILADLDSIKLSIQEDKSLGFKIIDTTDGFKIFEAASLVGYMQLDNSGLHSNGYLKFLSTYAKGKFDLRPDTLIGFVDSLIVYPIDEKQKISQNYPSVYPSIIYNNKAKLILHDNNDSTQTMYLEQASSQGFELFSNFLKDYKKAYLDSAKIEIGYTGAKASGIMKFIDAQIVSDNFNLSYDNFTSDTCRFELKDSTFSQTMFNTDNVSCYMDLITQIGTFVSNTIDNYVEFPQNRYIVYSDHFQWKINEGLIDIGGGLDDPRFLVVSNSNERDSLIQIAKKDAKFIRLSGTKLISMKRHNPVNFSAARTTYIPKKNILLAYDVPFLKIADAQIKSPYPIIIGLGGEIDTIHNGKVIVGKFQHKIFDADIKVIDSLHYSAHGYYTYPLEQKIFFSTITVKDRTTFAYAKLEADTFLLLNHYFKFYGSGNTFDILLRGDRKFLQFSGYVGIMNECEKINPRLVAIDTIINPDTVLIPIRQPIAGKFSRLYATPVIHKIDQSRYRLYNTFLTPVPDNTDKLLIPTNGFLTYSTKKAYYLIGSKTKVMNPDTILPMISYDYKRCLMFAHNKIDWQINYGDIMKYKVWGSYRSYLEDDEHYFFSTIISLDFHYPSKVFEYMIKDINNNDSLDFVFFDENKNLYNTILISASSDKERLAFVEEGSLPSSLSGKLVLADLNLKWDPNRVSFRTPKGKNRFIVLSIDGKQLDVYVRGYVEFRYKRNNISRILIYIEIEPGVWYFFWYQFKGKNATMRVASYNNKAEKYISQLSKKQRELYKHFTIGTAEKDELLRFLSLYGKKL